MSVVNSAIVWDHRGRTKRGGEGPLEYRITIDRKSWYINTGVKVCRNEWKFGAVINRADADVLNDRLKILVAKIETEINRCIENDVPIDVAKIRETVWPKIQKTKSYAMIVWMKNYVETQKKALNTKKQYYQVLRKLEKCGMTDWQDMDVNGIRQFDEFMKNGKTNKKYKCEGRDLDSVNDSSIYMYHSKVRAMLKKAKAEGIIRENPYDTWKPEKAVYRQDVVDYLDETDMETLQEWQPTNDIYAKAKDLFLFQCYTGLAFADMQNFQITAYRKINGRWIARSQRIKTGVPYVNVLLTPAVEILERYDWKIPKVSISWYDIQLARMGKIIGLPIRLRSHVARHTFATMMLRNGVKIENLARMLGHTNITQTQRYAKVLAVSVQEEFEMIEKKLFK